MALPDGDELAKLYFFDIGSGTVGGLYGPNVSDRGNLYFFDVTYGSAFPQGGVAGGGLTPPAAGFSRFWRVKINSARPGGSDAVGFDEIELHATIGGADEASGGIATASSTDGSYVVDRAFDDSTATFWKSTNTPTLPVFVEYDFPTDKQILELSLRSISTSIYSGDFAAVDGFELQYYDIVSFTWITVLTVASSAAWGVGETRLYSYSPAGPSSATRPMVFVVT